MSIFERRIVNPREKPLEVDFNRGIALCDQSLRDVLLALSAYSSGVNSVNRTGFIGSGFRVVPNNPLGMSVVVMNGFGLAVDPTDVISNLDGIQGLDDRAVLKPLVASANVAFSISPAPAAGNSRIDIIETKVLRRRGGSTNQLGFDEAIGDFRPGFYAKTLSYDVSDNSSSVLAPNPSTAGLSLKIGTAAPTGTEVAPTPTTGYTKVAEILVAAGQTTIDADSIRDTRPLFWLQGGGWWSGSASLAAAPSVTIGDVISPPGVTVSLYAFNTNTVSVVVLGGDNLMCVGQAGIADISGGTSTYVAQCSGSLVSAGVLEKNYMLLGTAGVKIATGQKVWSGTIHFNHIANGGVVNQTLPDPLGFTLNLRLGAA